MPVRPGQRSGNNVSDVQKMRMISEASDQARDASDESEDLLPELGIASGPRIREWRLGILFGSCPLLATLGNGRFGVLGNGDLLAVI